jgi:type IV secretion system protein VirB1
MLATLVLAQLLRDCASNVSPQTMAAVVRVESGGNPLAMHDNTLGRSFSPGDTATATAWANQLIGMGHSVDLGLSQINSANLPGLGLSAAAAFDPCTNLRAGATILGGDYASAAARFGPGQVALRRALGAYNTGSLFAGQGYVNQILVAAGLSPDDGGARPAAVTAGPVLASIPVRRSSAVSSGIVVYGTRPSYRTSRAPGSSIEVITGNP